MASTGQTWVQTVQPVQSSRSICDFGLPVFS